MRQKRIDTRLETEKGDAQLQKLSFRKKYKISNRLQGKSNLRDVVKDYNGK